MGGLVRMNYPPASFIYSVFRLLDNDFRAITFFIFFTANILAASTQHNVPMQYWFGYDMEKDGKMDTTLCFNLHPAWKNTLRIKTGLPSFNLEINVL
jgi:hypothetical protein